MDAKGYAAFNNKDQLKPLDFKRREVGANDVGIDILYCGVCHSDIHWAHNDWGGSQYPVVPGHEIIGKVIEVGKDVSKFKKDQLVGVGCLINSCRSCSSCQQSLEQYCAAKVMTYGSPDEQMGGVTHGGYSDKVVVDQDFVLSVADSLDLKAVAPLLCAGITTYSPLRHWNVQQGDKVGVVGLGGLGHMGVKLAAAMGAEVVMITRSSGKSQDATNLGASSVLLSTDAKQMAEHANSFDFILNTIPVEHDINPYIQLLKPSSTMCIVGAIGPLPPVNGADLVLNRKAVAGSLIGGIKETQEMLDFCAKHNIVPDVEMINIQEINTAFERVQKSDVKYRFVIDMASLKQ